MIGLEPTFDAHLERLVEVFREVRRVLRERRYLLAELRRRLRERTKNELRRLARPGDGGCCS